MSITEELPATLDERQSNIVQMQTIDRLTVEKGVMQLPVNRVAGAENSDQWAIDLEHPVEGELRFFVKKPTEGWHEGHEFVKLLDWYDIFDNNPYKLQEKYLYVRKSETADRNHGWELVNPDYREVEKQTKWELLVEKINNIRNKLPERTIGIVYFLHLIIPTLTATVVLGVEYGVEAGIVAGTLFASFFMAVSMMTVVLLPPPEE